VSGYLDIIDGLDGVNGQINDLSPLSDLTSIGTDLFIERNDALTNVGGLSGITSVGGNLLVLDNPTLTNVDGLSGLTSVGGIMSVSFNDALANVDGLSGLISVGGSLFVENNSTLTNVDGLSGLTSVQGDLSVENNPTLTNVDGFSGLTSLGGSLFVENNSTLTNVDGLSSITSVEGTLRVVSNSALTNVDGLSGIASVGGNLRVSFNDALPNVDGLSGIASVGSIMRVGSNSALSRCNCGLYDLLTTSGAIGGPIYINSNAPGCNSDTEVINQGPCDAGDCTPTMLAESAPYVGGDGAGRVDLTFSTPDGIEEIDFSLLENLALETSAPAFDAQTTGGDGLPTYTYNTAPQQIDITLIQQDTGNESAGYFGIARSVCPWVDGDQLAVEFDPPLEFALDVPERLALAGAYPNPTPGAATVGFTLPAATDVRLAVYDVMGRKVATLIDQAMDAGQHEVRWTGRSAEGQAVASGVYLIRLEADERVATRRLTVVK
jgi:hypothetical protein